MKRIVGFLRSNARWFWTIGALGAMTLALVSGVVFWLSLNSERARQAVEEDRGRALETIISANSVESAVLDRQRSIRGAIITRTTSSMMVGDESAVRLSRLASLVRDDPVQKRRVEILRGLVDNQSRRIDEAVADVAAGRPEVPARLVAAGTGEVAIEQVKNMVDDIVAAERSRLQERRIVATSIARNAENFTYAIGMVGVLVIVLAGMAVMVSLSATWSLRLKEVERELADSVRENEERMRIAHEATGAGTWEYDPDAKRLIWSAEMFRLYGRDVGGGVPDFREWRRMVNHDDVGSCPWLKPEGPGRISFETTFRISTPSGGWRWIVSRGFCFQSDHGVRIVGLDVDVTEQVSNREELARLNDLLSREAALVFDVTRDMMAVISDNGTLLSVNPAWGRVLGRRLDDIVGRNVNEFLCRGDAWRDEEGSFPVAMVAEDGSIRTVEWSVSTDPTSGRAVAAGRDVTEQRDAEAKLRDAEEAIRQMQKIETVGQMTGGVAHDFNNMLTPIVGYLDMLAKRHADDPKTTRMINMALQSAEKARTLVSKLLSFARRQQLEYKVVDAVDLVRGMSELIDKAVAGSGIETSVEADGGPACVRVDPNQFEMVLMNLAVNARDAMPDGGRIRVTVRRALEDCAPPSAGLKPGRYVVVSVADTGTGMDSATLQKAIEPFYSTKGVGKGTGLGLSMAHGMAGQSGGSLVLSSEVGVGTVASVWLPEMDADLLQVPSRISAARVAEASSPLSILLVDDDDNVRSSIAAMLADLGHSVKSCSSGAEALSVLATEDAFDLLVTDYLMPSMTGKELLLKVREFHPAMPAVIVSGYTNVTDHDGTIDAVRLAKPFTGAGLKDAVARALPTAGAGVDNVVELKRRPRA